jgi:hypothetical protein
MKTKLDEGGSNRDQMLVLANYPVFCGFFKSAFGKFPAPAPNQMQYFALLGLDLHTKCSMYETQDIPRAYRCSRFDAICASGKESFE